VRASLGLVLVLALAGVARADGRGDAVSLARSTVEKHRSEGHKARFLVQLPEPGEEPRRGSARLEARSGRYAIEERGYSLVLDESGARLTVCARTHIPTFAARAAGRRDSASLLEARLPSARARVALLALEVLANGRETPRDEPSAGPLDPRLDLPEPGGDEEGPRLSVELAPGGRESARRTSRRGAFAELARRLLDDLGAESGLSDPEDRDDALRRLLPALKGAESARAAFILGDAAFPEAWPRLQGLEFEEARDAREKIAARWAKDARARLVALSTRSPSWDVRRWARERLAPAEWTRALLEASDAPEDALIEALAALDVRDDGLSEKISKLADDPRPLVRVEAAAALARLTRSPRAKQVLAAVSSSKDVPAEARETAIARLGAVVAPSELGPLLAPIVTDPDAPASVRAQAARALDQAEAVSAAEPLAHALEKDLERAPSDEAAHDLRLALVAALSTVAAKAALLGSPSPEAVRALGAAALVDTDEEDVRALAIHAAGALAGADADRIVAKAAESEAARDPPARLARRAADLETAARSKDEAARLLAVADSACEAPLRSTLDRLAKAARSSGDARTLLIERLRSRGADGELGLRVVEEK